MQLRHLTHRNVEDQSDGEHEKLRKLKQRICFQALALDGDTLKTILRSCLGYHVKLRGHPAIRIGVARSFFRVQWQFRPIREHVD